jgi:hypothetical protein
MFFLLITVWSGAVIAAGALFPAISLPLARQGKNLPCRAAQVPCRKMRDQTWPDILSHWRNGDSRQTNPRDYQPECDYFPYFPVRQGKSGDDLKHRTAPPSSCGHVVYKQCSPAETLRGIENKLEYERLETERVIRQHGITRFQRNPSFLVNTLPIMRGAIAAEMTTPT